MSDHPPHVDRMAAELKELQERLQKLGAFLMDEAGPYRSLPDCEQALLNAQHGAMLAYEGVLIVRLNLAMGS